MRRRTWVGLIVGGVIVIGLAAIVSRPGGRPALTPTPADYPFTLREEVAFVTDTSQHGVCNSRFAGGQVLDQEGQPVEGLVIVIRAGSPPTHPEEAIRATTGNAPQIGPGGWHAALVRLGEPDGYTLELRDPAGALLAVPVAFAFPENCAENLARVDFVRARAG